MPLLAQRDGPAEVRRRSSGSVFSSPAARKILFSSSVLLIFAGATGCASGVTPAAPAGVTPPLAPAPQPVTGPLLLSPSLTSVTTSQILQLQVKTTGVTNTQVNWAVDGVVAGDSSKGTITPDGAYTPPGAEGAHVVTATLKTDSSVAGSAQVRVTDFDGMFTWRNDNLRSGENRQELALAPDTVSATTFGKLFSCPVDGDVYAQPLLVANLFIPGGASRNVVFVATEKDSVYAFDADANPCVQLWRTTLVPAGEEAVPTPNLEITSSEIVPFIGITGTPVIDAVSSTLYVVAKTRTLALNPVYRQRIFALELATGLPKIEPSGMQISTPASVTPGFSALLTHQRAALLLDNGTVYVAFASHEELGDYHGWLLGYDSATLQQVFVFNASPGGVGGAIGQTGGAPSADGNHNLYAATGHGPFDIDRGGANYGNSLLRLSHSGGAAVADYFAPCDQQALSAAGTDFGASAPLLFDQPGAAQPRLAIVGSENGSLYALNRDNLGGYPATCQDLPPRVQRIPVGDGPILGTPLFWNDAIYVAAGNGRLKAFAITGGVLASVPRASQSPDTLGPQGATPVVSSKDASNAIIWLLDTSGALATPRTPAILRAYDAGDLSRKLYDSGNTASPAVRFAVPTVANGKAYVGGQNQLDVYGLLAP